ncbi:MAG: hypothetical protein AABX01_02285 [Candidatus Micrarchaeota archaeon]
MVSLESLRIHNKAIPLDLNGLRIRQSEAKIEEARAAINRELRKAENLRDAGEHVGAVRLLMAAGEQDTAERYYKALREGNHELAPLVREEITGAAKTMRSDFARHVLLSRFAENIPPHIRLGIPISELKLMTTGNASIIIKKIKSNNSPWKKEKKGN